MTTPKTNNLKSIYPDETFPSVEIVPDALIWKLTEYAGELEGDEPQIKVPYIKEDPTVGFTAEGAEIGTSEPTLDEITINTGKLAVISTLTNEAASHMTAPDLVAKSMRRAVTRKADVALFGNGAAPTGLANVPGISDGFNLDGETFDAIADAIIAVQSEGATPNHLVTSPDVWGNLLKLKAAEGSNTPLIGSPSTDIGSTLYGIPVAITTAVPKGKLFVIDSEQILSAVGQIHASSSELPYFSHDVTAYKVTWRIGWNLIHPERLAIVTDPTLTEKP